MSKSSVKFHANNLASCLLAPFLCSKVAVKAGFLCVGGLLKYDFYSILYFYSNLSEFNEIDFQHFSVKAHTNTLPSLDELAKRKFL